MSPTNSLINSQQLLQPAGQISYRKRKYQNSATSDNEFTDDESSPKTGSPSIDADKRNHHNELERRRRDHIKDHFTSLKSSIPLLEGEKSSRALILKRAVDYIGMLQRQVNEYKSEVDDLKRRNENLSQQNNGLNLKPFLTSLQLQNPMFNSTIAQQSQSLIQASNIPSMPTTTTLANSIMNSSPTTSFNNTDILMQGNGSLTNGLPNTTNNGFYQPTKSPQSAITTPIQSLQNPSILANLSNLLLQNPSLINQLQTNIPAFEPLTPPSSASSLSNVQTNSIYSNLSPELVDAQARLLASSLALRERQFANAVATSL